MDICLDDKTSLMIVRATATNRSLALAPVDVCRPVAPAVRPAKLGSLNIPELLGYLRIPEERPLGIVVPTAADRVRAQGIHCSVDALARDSAPFVQLCSADASQPSPIVPSHARVLVQSPKHIVLGMARRLRRLEIVGKLDHQRALLMLVKLCLELCGTYAHDPFDPNNAPVIFDVNPRLARGDLVSFLQRPGAEQGLSLAREAADLVYDLSGSPQESFLGPALFFDSRLGGLSLCDFVANEPLSLTPEERASIGYRKITPDFTLVNYNSVVEYLGEVHREADNPRIDHKRSLDYQTLGRREYAFWYEDVDTKAHFMTSAARVVKAIESYDGPATRRRFVRLANDPAFRVRQQVLFEVFRPWLRGRPGTTPR